MILRTPLKLSPPDQRSVLSRPRLLMLLGAEILRHRVTLISADAGYGKTTLLRDFFHTTDAAVGWYQLDRTDRHLVQFIGYLTDIVRHHAPAFALPPNEPTERTTKSAPECEEDCHYLALQFAHEFTRTIDAPFIVILDNYDHVNTGAEVNTFLNSLIEFAPRHFHLVISSRGKPPLPWPRLRARQDVFELGYADLAFTVTETHALCAQLLGTPLPDEAVTLLQEKTEGWAAGIVMINQTLHGLTADGCQAKTQELSGNTRVLREFFQEEVLAHCAEDVQTFLMRTAILPALNIDICDDLVPDGNASETLGVLESTGIFVRPSRSAAAPYRFHPLFRQFLVEQLRTHTPADTVRELYLHAAIALEGKGDIEEARRCYMEAGAFDTVADLLERVADDFLERYMLDIVKTWMSAIPERVRAGRPWLLAFHGKTMRRLGNPSVALPILEMAWKLFAERAEEFGMTYVAYEAGFTYSQIGQARRGVETLQATLERIGPDHALRARLFVALCLNYLHLDELDLAEQCGNLVLHELGQVPLHPAQHMLESRGRQYLAQVYARRGTPPRALEESTRSLDLCEQEDLGNFKRSWALHTQGLVLALQGSWKAAMQALQEAEDCGDRDNRLQARAINHVRGNIYREMGDFTLAEECYQRCGEGVLIEEALLRLRENRIDEADSLAQMARRFFAERDSVVDRAVAEVIAVLIAEAQGEVDTVARRLEEAATVFLGKKTDQLLASANLQLARWHFAQGCESSAIRYMRLAFDIAASHDLRHFLWCELDTLSTMLGHALKYNIHPHQAANILQAKLREGYSTEFLPLLNYPDFGVQEHVARILDSVAHSSHSQLGVAEELLETCADKQLHLRLLKYVSGEVLPLETLLQLRSHHRLTWREVEVYAVYFQHLDDKLIPRETGRKHVAAQLHMSENTLKIHVNNIRRKLGLRVSLK